MYQRLVAYKKEHNHAMVPTNYKEDPQLGHWVHNQRNNRRNEKMTEERKHLLDYVGLCESCCQRKIKQVVRYYNI